MWSTVIQVLAAVGGLGVPATLVTALAMRRKIRAEATKSGADATSVLTGAAADLVDDIRKELREVRTDLDASRQEVRALRRHVGQLEGLLRTNGLPVPEIAWPPPIGA